MIRRQPRSTRPDTLFPSPTRFRSHFRNGRPLAVRDIVDRFFCGRKMFPHIRLLLQHIFGVRRFIRSGLWRARDAGAELLNAPEQFPHLGPAFDHAGTARAPWFYGSSGPLGLRRLGGWEGNTSESHHIIRIRYASSGWKKKN